MKNPNQQDVSRAMKQAQKNVKFNINDLKKAADQGNIDDFIDKNLSSEASSKLKNVLSDKEATEKLLSTPQAKELMKKLLEGK